MFRPEAEWVGKALAAISFSASPVACLNLGSSTKAFRERQQPFIAELIFAPLAQRAKITHCDIKKAEGVDLVGDLADERFVAELSAKRFDLIVCTNLLMHLERPELAYHVIEECLSAGGYLVLTNPTLYPYCGDPIDSKYRPSVEQIAAALPQLELVTSEILRIEHSHSKSLLENPKSLLIFLANILLPLKGGKQWWRTVSDLGNLFSNYRVACVVMKKNA